jgi:8-oxo-dGTP diphosphatase
MNAVDAFQGSDAGYVPHEEHQHYVHGVDEEVPDLGFCQRCGGSLADMRSLGRPLVCSGCGFVTWQNPKLATGVVVEHMGSILLVRRNHEPMYGRWSFPSGFVDRGETVEDAACREVLEETAVEVVLEQLLGVYSSEGDPVVFIAYAGHTTGGSPQAGPEAIELGLFPPGQLPELAFDHDSDILAAWWRARGTPDP